MLWLDTTRKSSIASKQSEKRILGTVTVGSEVSDTTKDMPKWDPGDCGCWMLVLGAFIQAEAVARQGFCQQREGNVGQRHPL